MWLTVDQLPALRDQNNIDISFVDRLGKTQHHSESGPLRWTVLGNGRRYPHTCACSSSNTRDRSAGHTLRVNDRRQRLPITRPGSKIDPDYGSQPVLVSLAEDGEPMTDAPYSTTNKAPAEVVAPGDYRGGRFANRICHIVVLNGAIAPDEDRRPRGIF